MCGRVWSGFGGVRLCLVWESKWLVPGGVNFFCVWESLWRVLWSEFVLCVVEFGAGLGE